MSKELLPVRDFIVVEKVKSSERVSTGGIVMPSISTDGEKVRSGKVLAVGSGTLASDGKVVPPEVKVGDTVYFLGSLSVDLKVDGEEFLMLREEHCMLRTQN